MKFYLALISIFVVFIGGVFIGYSIFKPQIVKERVSSQVILETLKNEGFLVTQSYILNQKINIDKTTGQMWKDFFWGQEITASAVMKISSGVDLSKLTGDDIRLGNKVIVVELPAIEINSTELFSDIELQNNQGILKKIFDSDDGYNLAMTSLKKEAQKAVFQEKMILEAQTNTQRELERLIRLIAPSWKLEMRFKKST